MEGAQIYGKSCHIVYNFLCHFVCACRCSSPKIPRDLLSFPDGFCNGMLDTLGKGLLLEVAQHHCGCQDERARVGKPFTCNIRCTTMHSLKHCNSGADVGPGGKPK